MSSGIELFTHLSTVRRIDGGTYRGTLKCTHWVDDVTQMWIGAIQETHPKNVNKPNVRQPNDVIGLWQLGDAQYARLLTDNDVS